MLLVLFSYWLFKQCGAMHANFDDASCHPC